MLLKIIVVHYQGLPCVIIPSLTCVFPPKWKLYDGEGMELYRVFILDHFVTFLPTCLFFLSLPKRIFVLLKH